MGKIILNIAKSYANSIITEFEKNQYFQLNKNSTTRADLYFFAIAIALMSKEKNKLIEPDNGPVDTFVRAEYLTNYEALLSAIFFEDNIKNSIEKIDDICNREDVYILAEKYANIGFSILKKWYDNNSNEETLLYKLIGYMDNKYDEIINEVNDLI